MYLTAIETMSYMYIIERQQYHDILKFFTVYDKGKLPGLPYSHRILALNQSKLSAAKFRLSMLTWLQFFSCMVLFGIDTVIQILNIRARYYSPDSGHGGPSIQSASDPPPPPYSPLENETTGRDAVAPGVNKGLY